MNGKRTYTSKDPIEQLKQEMKLRGFSQKTIQSYLHYINDSLRFARRGPREMTTQHVRDYLEFFGLLTAFSSYSTPLLKLDILL